jgi:hypothetical protein
VRISETFHGNKKRILPTTLRLLKDVELQNLRENPENGYVK